MSQRSTIPVTQIRLTGSSASSETAVVDASVFMIQHGSSGATKVVTAAVMQDYFGDPDVTAASGATAMKLIFASGTGDRKELFADAGTGLQFTPSTDDLSVGGDVTVGDDLVLSSDAALISFGAGAPVSLTHVASNDALRLTAAKPLEFGDAGTFIQQSSDGVLQLQADTTVDINGGDIDIDGAAITVDASSGLSLQAAAASDFTLSSGDLSLIADAANAKIVLRSDVTGSATAIHLDGDQGAGAVVDIDAGQLDIDASDWVKIDAADEIEVTTTSADGHITLHSAHTAGQAILIDANAAAGSILDVDAGILTVDTQGAATHTIGGAFLLDGASTVGIQGAGTISLGTADSGVAVNIGHGTSEVTIGDNLVVTGDLTVNGTNTVVNSTVTTMDDPLIVLGKDNPTTSRDLGLIFEQTGSSSNVGLFYDSSATEFAMKTGMTEDGTTAGNINDSGSYAKLRIGSLVIDSASQIGSDGAENVISIAANGAVTFTDNSQNVNIAGHDAGTNGLALGGTLVSATAAEINLLDATAGSDTALASGDAVFFGDASDSNNTKKSTMQNVADLLGGGDGVQVNDSTAQLSVDLREEFFASGSSNLGTTYTVALAKSAILDNSFEVYLNGMLQLPNDHGLSGRAGDFDYSHSGTTLTMADAMQQEDILHVKYQKK